MDGIVPDVTALPSTSILTASAALLLVKIQTHEVLHPPGTEQVNVFCMIIIRLACSL